jgi:hypothetical protein
MTSPEADYKSQKTNQDRYREVVSYAYVAPEHRRPMLLGALIGLILGLIIGWVIWPVQWTNAYPSDLAEEPKAEYLSSVADAYVAVSDDGALALASKRLALFGSDPAAEIQAAIVYFEESGQPNNLIRINNLNALATDLGLLGESASAATDATAETEQPTAGSDATDTADAADGDAGGWFRWIIILVMAAVLIVVGVMAIRALSRKRPTESTGAVEHEFLPEQTAFDEDQYPGHGDTTIPPTESERGEPPTSEAAAVTYEEYVFNDDPEEISYRPPQTVSSQIDLSEDDELPSDFSVPSSNDDIVAKTLVTGALLPPHPHTPNADRESMGSFVATYQVGMPDYDQAFPITEPESERYVGECGMGVNSKSSILHDDEDQVIALDVWLFDKTDERHIGSHIRVLLSEYAFDHDMGEKIADEKEGDPRPIVAQPGISFTLQGGSLQLDCRILEVNYVASGEAKGTFQNIEVEMDVSRRE